MTEQEKKVLLEQISKALEDKVEPEPKKELTTIQKKHLFSKLIVCLCIFLAIGYTGLCLLMQWFRGIQPEPQLTISFMGFVAAELWSLSKIKRDSK